MARRLTEGWARELMVAYSVTELGWRDATLIGFHPVGAGEYLGLLKSQASAETTGASGIWAMRVVNGKLADDALDEETFLAAGGRRDETPAP